LGIGLDSTKILFGISSSGFELFSQFKNSEFIRLSGFFKLENTPNLFDNLSI
jgi:hypothetical protein